MAEEGKLPSSFRRGFLVTTMRTCQECFSALRRFWLLARSFLCASTPMSGRAPSCPLCLWRERPFRHDFTTYVRNAA